MEYILNDAQARVLLVGTDFLDHLAKMKLETVERDAEVTLRQMRLALDAAKDAKRAADSQLEHEQAAATKAATETMQAQQEVAEAHASADEPFFFDGTDAAIGHFGVPVRYAVIRKSPDGKVGLQVIFNDALLPSGAVINKVGGPAAEWTFALVSVTYPAALIALAVGHERGSPRLRWVLVGLWGVAVVAIAVILMLDGRADHVLWLGLPPATVVMLVGLGLLPMVVVPLVYVASFEESD